jgi:SAM-dependent methyltransferase
VRYGAHEINHAMFTKLRSLLLTSLPEFSGRCRVCFAATEKRRYTLETKPGPDYHVKFKTLDFDACPRCGYYFAAKNFNDYEHNNQSIFKAKKTARVGDGTTPGREYYMTVSAIDALQRDSLTIAVFGAGLSRDHELIRAHPAVAHCAVIDLVNFQGSEYFEPVTTKRQFDIMVASEVFEHFMRPRKELARCLTLLRSDGLLVASTNLNAKKNIAAQAYPFLYGHTSYYSNRSLVVLAHLCGGSIRIVRPEYAKISPAKRYLYFTKSATIDALLGNYLAAHPVPPSEPADSYVG